MKNLNTTPNSKLGKRTFTSERVPVSSALGRALIYGKDSKAIVAAVRSVVKNGESSEVVNLQQTTLRISDITK